MDTPNLESKVSVLEERVRNLYERLGSLKEGTFSNADGVALKGRIHYLEMNSVTREVAERMNSTLLNLQTNSFTSEEGGALEHRVLFLETQIKRIEDATISKHEFGPVRTLVFGATGLLLIGIVGGLLKVVLK